MVDFTFLKNKVTGRPVILAPRRSHRTNREGKIAPICPFCVGSEETAGVELYRFPQTTGDDWHIRVIQNAFPFTPHHEIIIHSPDHHKNFDELPFSQVELIFQTYRQRYRHNMAKGNVYIFHNRGGAAGESIPHPHTQVTVIPDEMTREIPPLDEKLYKQKSSIFRILFSNRKQQSTWEMADGNSLETEQFLVFCPRTSEWPDEVCIAPKRSQTHYGDSTDAEMTDLAFVFSRILHLFNLRHGQEFPFNFYIYPGKNWYLRFIPRMKVLGGFELGTQVMVNTQRPSETFAFLSEHFWEPDAEHIKRDYQADYLTSV